MKIYYNGLKYYALNEAIVERALSSSSMSGTAKLSLKINGNFVDKYSVDGLIVSTPRGSTAYSLSAGGAIMTPDISAFIVTPVCPHSLHNRPIVFSDNLNAEITLLDGTCKCGLFVDGKFIKTLKVGDKVNVCKSKRYVKFYSTEDNFFSKLLIKLNKWSETV